MERVAFIDDDDDDNDDDGYHDHDEDHHHFPHHLNICKRCTVAPWQAWRLNCLYELEKK